MRLLDDDRGQSIQVGAAILLGFVVITITIYQVEVVANQNTEVEFNHNQEVRQDLTELRNSISNAGEGGTSDSVSVQLGTQYPPRTIFVNPPPVQGQLRTETTGNISFGDDTVADGSYSPSAQELLEDDHRTSRIVYAPRYFELDDAGVTTLEHSLAYNSFENGATDPITAQQIVDGDSLQLTVLRGNVSEQGAGSVSIDPRTVSGPTDPITIRNDSGGPVVLHLPTETPAVWNETLGTEYGDNDAQVSGFDGERVRVELNRSEYELQMALVGVGDRAEADDRYEVSERNRGGGGGGGGAYSLYWQDPSGSTGTEEPCDADACIWNVTRDSELNLTAETDPSLDRVDVDFAVNDSSVATVSGYGETSSGTQTATLNATGTNGTVAVYATSDGSSDIINVSVRHAGDGGGDNTAPSISNFQATNPSGTVINVSFDSSEQLSNVAVDIRDSGGSTVTTLTEANFTSSGGTYWATYDTQACGAYTANLTQATDTAGNDGAIGESDSVNAGSSADCVQVVDGSAIEQDTGWLQFQLENSGPTTATIQQVSVSVPGAGSIDGIYEGDGAAAGAGTTEMYFDTPSDSGYLESGDNGPDDAYSLGSTVTLTEQASLGADETATTTFYRFGERPGGSPNWNPVSVSGETVEVSITFADGSTGIYTIDVP